MSRAAAKSLKVDYPIAIDSNYGTWNAYGNEYWPAEYLIDPTGEVRAYDFGEGGYSTMEANIRSLLHANGAKDLPPATDVANKTPTQQLSPESYLGYQEIQYDVGDARRPEQGRRLPGANPLPPGSFAFNGSGPTPSRRPRQARMPPSTSTSQPMTSTSSWAVRVRSMSPSTGGRLRP